MATASCDSQVEQIGATAGEVWQVLSEQGSMSMARLIDAVGHPRNMVMLALGWLAREDKISIEEDGRARIVSLR